MLLMGPLGGNMGRIVFEFDEDEEWNDVNLVVNRHKLITALYDLENYRRGIYKGYINNADYAVDGKIVGKWDDIRDKDFGDAKIKAYLDDEDVLRELDYILDKVRHLLN